MADNNDASRARAARTRTWPVDKARRAWGAAWPQSEFAIPARIYQWAAIEVGAGRLLPWFAVAFGAGIVLYFTAEHEPAVWAASGLAIVAIVAAVLLRRRPLGFVLALGFVGIAAGFATATLKTALIDHPILRYPAYSVSLAGFVELREESQKTDRFILRVDRIEGARISDKPRRVRLSVKRGTAPPAGAFVEVKAQLQPPLQPLRPGSYDFARDLFFQRLGASGFVHGAVKIVTPPAAAGLRLRADAAIQNLRDAIDFRIRSVLKGDVGSIASALITGKRDAIAPNVYDAMFVSGIGHVLSISGYHMAVVAGVVFFVLRALLALIPGLADRAPVKKWSAFAALLVTAFYLVLSGAEVATQRSFIMIAIVLVGTMLDRPILTLRTVTIAALVVLLLAPEAVVHPSFQMSFAATLALIAAYSHGLPTMRAGRDSPLHARAALWGVNEAIGLVLASLIAGLATTPYAAYHFHRLAPYGVLSNLLAMPVVSAWVMPMGILGVLAIPFGFDAEFWRQMGYGIEWMDAVALWVAGLPGAFGRVTSFGTGTLLLATAGLLLIGLLKTPLRWSGVLFVALAIVVAARTPRPDILVASDGRAFAVRGADGRLAFHRNGGDTFTIKEWLAADADGRNERDPKLGAGIACDPSGCVGKLADGRLVSYALSPEAFEEDCRRAAVMVATRDPPSECAAMVIGRKLWRQRGALTLRADGKGFVLEAARAANFDRPWARSARTSAATDDAAKSTVAVKPTAASRNAPRDATPRVEDLEADQ
ncbi:MAG TPA: ComEC/Rec2 family competence protein [Xanthobacteraceae bacterium]|nr:ComEC/Rec2 family competence protein [Xanthobacteraceae bacterium]